MSEIGIVEGFFGPEWPHEARLQYAAFLSQFPNSFYFYAPKRDPHLRKEWRQVWSSSYLERLQALNDSFQKSGVSFGIGLSPFGLGKTLSLADRKHLQTKISQLSDLGISKLGLFFDDMPSSEHLADVQAEVVQIAAGFFSQKLMFCPSYYTYDPILDKVFGQRPTGYLEQIAASIPQNVSLLWTGPKVISEEITHQHLMEVTALLKRKPFIWENLYANDGPRNCQFLKLKYFTGRDSQFLEDIEGMALNLMNQAHLSQVLFLASHMVLSSGFQPEVAFEQSLKRLVGPALRELILQNRDLFLGKGLEKIRPQIKTQLLVRLEGIKEPIAQEISDWLKGSYLVGPECLTD